MIQYQSRFCFCSLAIGQRYRALALLLAQDIQKYSPNTALIILTDKPQDFSTQSNVIAYKHRQQGIKCYHDKRFVISKALLDFNSCIYIDADMRITAPMPSNIQWIDEPGISARACDSMPLKYIKIIDGIADSKLHKEFKVTQNAAKKLGIHQNWQNITFVHEYLFAVTKDNRKENLFLEYWGKLAPYFELNGVLDGEGNAIGLASAKAGLSIRWCEMEGISFFKDRTEMVRIKKGESSVERMSIYFEQQQNLEYCNSLLTKISTQPSQLFIRLLNWIKLCFTTLNNITFYYW
ncbi:MAG: hypothetical protein IGS39_02020 [Calothrix sp. C42_A2020_038]|nr:hypothetical protein [Calothrix sp. C42_A2020_038]